MKSNGKKGRTKWILTVGLLLSALSLAPNAVRASFRAAAGQLSAPPPARASAQRSSRRDAGDALSQDRDFVMVGRTARPERLADWQAAGVRFEGHWQTEQVSLVLDVLDRFAHTFGEAQLLNLIQHALRLDPHNASRQLIFVRVNEPELAAAGWVPFSGEVRLNDILFDDAVMAKRYRWSVLRAHNAAATQPITIQEAVVAHELGHVLLDGIRVAHADESAEAVPLGEVHAAVEARDVSHEEAYANFTEAFILEETYADELYIVYWPHPTHHVNESLATEVGLWALGVQRPPQVRTYRELHLGPALANAAAMDLP